MLPTAHRTAEPSTPDPRWNLRNKFRRGRQTSRPNARTSRRHVRAITGAQRYIGSQQKTPPGGVHNVCSRV